MRAIHWLDVLALECVQTTPGPRPDSRKNGSGDVMARVSGDGDACGACPSGAAKCELRPRYAGVAIRRLARLGVDVERETKAALLGERDRFVG